MSSLLDILLGKSDSDEGGLPGILQRAGLRSPSLASDGLQDMAFSPELRRKRAVQREALASNLARSDDYTPGIDEDPPPFTGEGVKTETSALDVYRRWLNNYFEGTSLYRPTSQPAPSLHDVLSRAISAGGEYAGLSDRGAQQFAEKLSLPAELFAPGIGTAVSADETKRAFERGDYGEAALDAVGAIPLGGPLGKLIAASIPMVSRGGKVVKGLAMDEASRMARAKAMGYREEPFFRGERTGIFPDEYREGTYFSRDPEYAAEFAKLGGHEEPREFRLKLGNTFDFHARKWSAQQRDAIVGEVAKKDQALAKEIGAAINEGTSPALIWQALSANFGETGGAAILGRAGFDEIDTGRDILKLTGTGIRSVDARFDPKRAKSTNIFAGLAAAGLIPYGMMTSQDESQ